MLRYAAGPHMSRPASLARRALLNALSAGASGTYEALAAAVGVSPGTARATLKELSRAGKAAAQCRVRRPGASSAAPAVYSWPHQQPLDALGFARQVWR